MRILVRTSKWAIWARRVGALALPLAALPVLLHHEHIIASEDFVVIEAIALGLAALAALMALIAFVRLWFTGDQGWWRATIAFIFAALCLGPAGFLAFEAVSLPATPDVSTDFANPPQLVSFVESRFIGPDERARIEAAYPNARTRNYPITAPQMFDVVSDLVDQREWDVRARREPQTEVDTGQINAIVTTLLGFRQEVALRIAGGPDGTTIDMRSTALTGFPDFGQDGARIESFLLDLDNQVTLLLRNTPAPSDG